MLAIVLLGVVGTGFAYILNYRVIADLGATRASLVTYVIPVVAVDRRRRRARRAVRVEHARTAAR